MCVCPSKYEYLCDQPIAIKFNLKPHWAGGKDALGFGPDRIRALVSMASDSSHRVIMEEILFALYRHFFSIFLQITWPTIEASMRSNFVLFRSQTAELAALKRLEKCP